MTKFPDKKTYRTSITSKLRQQIIEEASSYDSPSFLEVGCDRGYTTLTVFPAFTKILALDIEVRKINECKKNLNKVDIGDCQIKFDVATMKETQQGHFDVVLIDASHEYKDAKIDTLEVLLCNLAETYTIFFHDYWLVQMGVAKLLHEIFTDDEIVLVGEHSSWEPRPGIRGGYEAAKVIITPQIRDRVLAAVKIK